VQRIFQIGLFAQSMKAANKANAKDIYQAFNAHLKVSSGESINATFVKVALSLFKVMQHAYVREVLLLGDELFGKSNPLTNSLYKIESVMQACGSDPAKFSTMLAYMFDLILNGELKCWECSWGPLTGKQQNNNKGTLSIILDNVSEFWAHLLWTQSIGQAARVLQIHGSMKKIRLRLIHLCLFKWSLLSKLLARCESFLPAADMAKLRPGSSGF
jgi:hypothetical protein